jgi:hypothetical protein
VNQVALSKSSLNGQTFDEISAEPSEVNQSAYIEKSVAAEGKHTRRHRSGPQKFIAALFSVILCIVIFALLFVSCMVLVVRASTSSDAVAAAIDSLDFSTLYVDAYSDSGQAQTTLAEMISVGSSEASLGLYTLSADSINKLLDESSTRSFLKEKLNDYLSALYHGTNTGFVTADEIVGILEENTAAIYEETGYQLTPADLNDIGTALTEGDLLKSLDLTALMSAHLREFTYVRWGLSDVGLIVLSVLALIFACVVLLINRRRVTTALLYIGVIGTILGVLYLAVGLLPSVVIDRIEAAAGLGRAALGVLLSRFFAESVKIGLISCIICALIIIASIVTAVLSKRRAAK